MQSALRPYVTAGVALVGASAIAVTPVSVPQAAVEHLSDRAVELSALVNPVDVFGPIYRDALANLQSTAESVVQNPSPILGQLIRNQFANIAGLPQAVQDQIDALPQLPSLLGDALRSELNNTGTLIGLGSSFIQNIITAITETGDFTAQASVQAALDALANNDLGGAFSSLSQVPLQILLGGSTFGNLGVILALTPALQQPFVDAQKLLPGLAGPLGNAEAAVGVLATVPLVVGIGALTPVITGGTAVANTLSEVIKAAQAGDPENVFNSFVTGSGDVTKALFDSIANDGGGGLLQQVQSLREQLAEAIGKTPPSPFSASVAALPTQATKSITLTAPVEKALPAPKVDAPSVGEKSGAVDTGTAAPGADTKDTSGTATSTGTKDTTKGGNLFTPGNTSTKGGRHRADTGSFAEGLRDTIKGLTGIGKKKSDDSSKKSEAGSESGSSSSGSGDSGSSGGGDSK